MRKHIASAFVSLDVIMQAPGGVGGDPIGGSSLGRWMFSYIFVLLFTPLIAMADGCSDEPPTIEKYSKTFHCPAATIYAKGEKYPEDSWECYDVVPIKKETLFYSSDKNKGMLPTVNSLLPAGNHPTSEAGVFKNLTWMASNIRCIGKEEIDVLYWSGGNCKGCERNVQYRFSKDGMLEGAKLQ